MKIKFNNKDKMNPENDLHKETKNWHFDVIRGIDPFKEQERWRALVTLKSAKTHSKNIFIFDYVCDSRDEAEKVIVDFADCL